MAGEEDGLEATIPSSSHPGRGISGDADPLAVSTEEPSRYRYGSGGIDAAHGPRVELGRGGMGRVLVAYDAHLGRNIAVKELLAGVSAIDPASDGRESTARFLREARVTAQLDHPNIVPVHELGRRSDGTLYYTMKLVRGRTLADAMAKTAELHERMRLLKHFADLAHAIAYAHSRGVVHRDLKPQNVMIGPFGETIVLDWGLAKVRGQQDLRGRDLAREVEALRDDDAFRTTAGSAFGTPAYMSPEQADGRIDDVDERSDVWSLGVVLYELLTGKKAFGGENAMAVMVRVMRGTFAPVREVCPEAPIELVAIAEHAMKLDKAARYPSAKELAEDIDAFLAGERVEVVRYSKGQELGRFFEAHRGRIAMLFAFAIVIGLLVVSAGRNTDLEDEREKSQAVLAKMNATLAGALTEVARAHTAARDTMGAEVYAAEALARAETPSARGALLDAAGAWRPTLAWELTTWPTACTRLAVSPDGATVACPLTTQIGRWDAKTGAERPLIPAKGWVHGLAFSSDGKYLAWGAEDGRFRVFDLAKNDILREPVFGTGAVRAIAWSAKGDLFAAGAEGGEVALARAETDELTKLALPGDGAEITALAFSPDGTKLAIGRGRSAGGAVLLVEVATRSIAARLGANDLGVNALAFSPDGARLLVGARGRIAQVFEVGASRPPVQLATNDGEVLGVAFSSDGELAFTASADHAVRAFEVRSGELVAAFGGHGGPVRAIATAMNGERLVTAGDDEVLRAWGLASTFERPRRRIGESAAVHALAWAPAGEVLVAATADGTIASWDLHTRAEPPRVRLSKLAVRTLSYGPGGRAIIAGTEDGTVWVYPTEQSEATRPAELRAHEGAVREVLFSADGRRAWSGGADGKLIVWSLAEHRAEATLVPEPPRAPIAAMTAVPSKDLVITASEDQALRLWDVEHGKLLETIPGRGAKIESLAVSPNGEHLAIGYSDRTVELRALNALRERPSSKIAGHEGAVTALAFSPDGRRLATGSADRKVRLYQLSTDLGHAELRAELEGHGDTITNVAFAPDGHTLASSSLDRTIRTWSLDLLDRPGAELVQRAKKDLGLELTGSELGNTRRPKRP